MKLTSILAQPLWRFYAKPRCSYTLREIIRRMLKSRQVSILQIGANDGVGADPIHPLLMKYTSLHATRVEPLAEPFRRLQLNSKRYAASTELFNVCVSDRDGQLSMRIPKDKRSDRTNTREASLLRSHEVANQGLETIENVTSVRFETLCQMMRTPNVDVYISDCEGYDVELLGKLPIQHLGVSVVYIELWDNPHSPEATADALANTSAVLGRNGFNRIVWDGQDVLSWKSPRFSSSPYPEVKSWE